MLHTHIYNNSLITEAVAARKALDFDALKTLIGAQMIAVQSATEEDYYPLVAKLMLTISLFDSLNGGQGTMLICDYINF